MTESLSNSRPVEDALDEINYKIEQAAKSAGRSAGDIALMAVTKTIPAEIVNRAVAHGVRLLGENKAQELLSKYDDYHKDGVSIHFIGGLQTNKVRQIIDKVDMIQSVDSLKLAREIDKQAKKAGKSMDILLEVNIGEEDTKSGVSLPETERLLYEIAALESVRVRGLMAIPPYSDNPADSERYFALMSQLFIDIKGKKIDNVTMDVLSMGMSSDYILAIKHGANLIRLGTVLFGERKKQ